LRNQQAGASQDRRLFDGQKLFWRARVFLQGRSKDRGRQGVSSSREVPQCQESTACDHRGQAKRKSNPPGDLANAEIVCRVLPRVFAHTSQIRVRQGDGFNLLNPSARATRQAKALLAAAMER
jgi:hypothetical protein